MTDQARQTIGTVAWNSSVPARWRRFLILAALVAQRRPPGLCRGGGWQSAALRPLDRQWRECAHHRPSRQPGKHHLVPDGRRIAYAMFVPDDGPRLGSARSGPRARSGPSRFRSSMRSLIAPTEPAISSPATPNCSGFLPTAAPAKRPSARPTPAVPSPWTPDSRSVLFGANLSDNWQRDPNEAEIYRSRSTAARPRADRSQRSRFRSNCFAERRMIAYLSADERGLFYDAPRLRVMNADGSGSRVVPGVEEGLEAIVWAPDSSAICVTHGPGRIDAQSCAGRLDLTDRWPSQRQPRPPYSGGTSSACRRTTASRSPSATIRGLPTSASPRKRGCSASSPASIPILRGNPWGSYASCPSHLHDQRPIDAGWSFRPASTRPAATRPFLRPRRPADAYGDNFSTDVQLYAAAILSSSIPIRAARPPTARSSPTSSTRIIPATTMTI